MTSPIYYLGWIIQPTPRGFVVYQNLDTSGPQSQLLRTIQEAVRLIDQLTQYERR